MRYDQLEHAIRAACDVSGDTELLIFGSQAILGSYPDAPEALRTSIEVDVQARNRPEMTTCVLRPNAAVRYQQNSTCSYGRVGDAPCHGRHSHRNGGWMRNRPAAASPHRSPYNRTAHCWMQEPMAQICCSPQHRRIVTSRSRMSFARARVSSRQPHRERSPSTPGRSRLQRERGCMSVSVGKRAEAAASPCMTCWDGSD